MRMTGDAFLSQRLGRPCHWLRLEDDAVDPAALRELLDTTLGDGPGFVQAKIGAADVGRRVVLQDLGFCLVDMSLVFSGRPTSAGGRWDGAVRPALDRDLEAVRILARKSFVYSRFYQDPLIPDATAGIIKADWAGNFFAGQRGDAMLVAETGDEVAGFLLLLQGKQALTVDLIAVDGRFRRRGAAGALVAGAMAEHGQGLDLTAGTQAANADSLAFYQSLGLRVVACGNVFHLHRG